MACITPPEHPNPLLDNRIVAAIQTALASAGWLDNIYPMAEVCMREIDGQEVLVPGIYGQASDNNYIEPFPDDSIRGGCFFQLPSGDFNFDFAANESTMNLTLEIVFWANLKRIANRAYDYTDELIGTAINAIKDSTISNDITGITVVRDRNRAFEKYGYTFKQMKGFMFPHTAFKLVINMPAVESNLECISAGFDQSYSPSCP
jgi:hypothetical protein